jgi:hypothetical protein
MASPPRSPDEVEVVLTEKDHRAPEYGARRLREERLLLSAGVAQRPI